jgi:hypothetical protein
LDAVLREEFTAAAEVTARGVEVTVDLPERLSAGTNLNSYRQEPQPSGFKVFLGDLVRPKEFIFEVTTPVALAGDELTIAAGASFRDQSDQEVQANAMTTVAICPPDQIDEYPIDEQVVTKLLDQLPNLVEMEAVVAYEAGDVDGAAGRVSSGLALYEHAVETYLAAGEMLDKAAGQAKLDELQARTKSRSLSASDLKRRYGASRRASRSRRSDPDADVK